MTPPEGARTERRALDRLGRDADEHTRRSPAVPTELPPALSVAAHDVAEAVRVVTGYLELLGGHPGAELDDTAQRFLGGIRDGVEHLDELLRGLLSYVRVNVEPLEIEDVDLGESLEEALRPLGGVLEQRVDAGELPTVRVDADRTRDLLRALLDNAVVFAGDEPPAVTVSAEREHDAWRISVRDAGIGLPADARERVLQPFERGHARSIATGPGLGLAIARRIAERRGGRLWLESAGDRGTLVHFTIPDRLPSA